MTNTTTQHIRALLVNDGHEFTMIRKTDLAALMQIADSDPHQGRYLDPIGAHKAEIQRLNLANDGLLRLRFKADRNALKHGEERRRYMANNKALLARLEGMQESLRITREARLWADHWYIAEVDKSAQAEAGLLRVGRFKRKFPAIAALMDMTP